MFGSEILEAAIGLCFIFIFVSLLSSAAREAAESILKSRAIQLEGWIRENLNAASTSSDGANGQPAPAKNLASDLYNHPLIFSTFAGQYTSGARTLPSYIAPKQFALALLDIVAPSQKLNEAPLPDGATPPPTSNPLDELKKSAANLPPNLGRIVSMAVDQAEGEIGNVRKFVEDWYNRSMERVSGWYKRQTQLLLFCFGLFAAACANVDAIAITKTLMTNKTARQELVAVAQNLKPAGGTDFKSSDAETMQQSLKSLDLPIGWDKSAARQFVVWLSDAITKPAAPDLARLGQIAQTSVTSLFGWLVTACATMLGAAFWFDMLNKLVSLRSSLKPESEPEDTKQPASR